MVLLQEKLKSLSLFGGEATNVKSVFLGNSWENSQNDSMWLTQFSTQVFKVWVPLELRLNLEIRAKNEWIDISLGRETVILDIFPSAIPRLFYTALQACSLPAIRKTLATKPYSSHLSWTSPFWGCDSFTHLLQVSLLYVHPLSNPFYLSWRTRGLERLWEIKSIGRIASRPFLTCSICPLLHDSRAEVLTVMWMRTLKSWTPHSIC